VKLDDLVTFNKAYHLMTSYLTSFLFFVFVGKLVANKHAINYHAKEVMSSRLSSLNTKIELTQKNYEIIIQESNTRISKGTNEVYYRKNEAEQAIEDIEIYDARVRSRSWCRPHSYGALWYSSLYSPPAPLKDDSLAQAQFPWEASSVSSLSISNNTKVMKLRPYHNEPVSYSSIASVIGYRSHFIEKLSKSPVLLSQSEAISLALHAEEKLGITLPPGDSTITLNAKIWKSIAEDHNKKKSIKTWEATSETYSQYYLKLTHQRGTKRNEFIIDWRTKKLLIVHSYSTDQ